MKITIKDYEHRFGTFEPQTLARSPREIAEETV